VLLKSIELFGFKSFADKSRIEFTDGVCALLGPNGCGKSNVVDAVKWVLGEQATKSLRADRMEDVIFNGTDNRRALNVAEVTMTLGNEAGLFPLDFSEISIKRRLFRNGESEYLINGAPVRLRELRELFYDTGVGKGAYSIMEQGKIDQILSTRPEDRREVFEEAAMITRYRAKGKEAERKLARTEENVRQVESVLGEVQKSYRQLEAQSAKTERYRTLRESIFEVERDLALLRLRSFLSDRDKRTSRLEGERVSRDKIKSEIDKLNEALESSLDRVNEMESGLLDGQKRLYQAELARNTAANQLRMLRERLSELKGSRQTEENQKRSVTERLSEAQKEREETARRVAEAEKDLAELTENIDEFAARIGSTEERLRSNRGQQKEHRSNIDSWQKELGGFQRELRDLAEEIVSQLDTGLKESGFSPAAVSEVEKSIAEALRMLDTEVSERLSALDNSLGDSALASPEALQKLLSECREGFEATKEQHHVLRQAFGTYAQMVPQTLRELVSPEGVMTRKRNIDDAVEKLTSQIVGAREADAALADENADLTGKIDEYRTTLEKLRITRAESQARRESLLGALRRLDQQVSEYQRNLEAIEERLSELEKRRISLEGQISEEASKETTHSKEMEAIRKEIHALEESIKTSNSSLRQKEESVKGLMEDLARAQTKVEKMQVQLAETTTEIRTLYENFADVHSHHLEEYESRLFEITDGPGELRNRLSQLRQEQRELGNVNLMAPEEFAEVKERYEFLTAQLKDLEKARNDLDRVTQEIQRESAQLFLETYEKIKRNFHTVFRRLFGGGRAEVRLTDPEDVLESGVEILVQPPGKKLESIALLSGGERSMTAVALLFAIYMVRPSPFCLLDEIDAALDESNVGRFVSLLHEFAEHSQFVVVTHNKKTVASANALVGVTMEEPGVSKVISVRVNNPDTVEV
jgi:chromosome segregation protein